MKQIKEMLGKKKVVKRLAVTCMYALMLSSMLVTQVCASGQFQGMDGAAKSVAEQIMWAGLALVGVIVLSLLASRNWVQAIVVALAGVSLCVAIGNIDVLKAIGEWGAEKITGMNLN